MDPVVGALALGAVVAAGAWLWLRRRGHRPLEEPYYHFLCPGCRRRLRYRARQAGNQGQCSRCGKSFRFPAVADAID